MIQEGEMLREYYNAAQNGAAVVEKDWCGIIQLAGSERESWLQGMVTNDVEKLGDGQGCYAAHMVILRDRDKIWLVLERASIAGLISAFDKLLIMEDVQVTDESAAMEIVG